MLPSVAHPSLLWLPSSIHCDECCENICAVGLSCVGGLVLEYQSCEVGSSLDIRFGIGVVEDLQRTDHLRGETLQLVQYNLRTTPWPDCNMPTTLVDLSNKDDPVLVVAQLNRFLEDVSDNQENVISSVNLSGNRLERLPEESLSALATTLHSLDVSNNRLTSLQELGDLEALEELDVHNNILGEVLELALWVTMCGSKPPPICRLKTLNVAGNGLVKFPSSALHAIHLSKLHLGGNRISFLPPEISCLKQLELLYIGGNQLRSVPDELSQLTKLTNLNLSDNLLESVPATLGKLTRLRCLALHGNRLHTLPSEIIQLVNLEVISLRNNPLVVAFARKSDWNVPSLVELSGRRCLQLVEPNQQIEEVFIAYPPWVRHYLSSASRCENPACSGVYFSSCVESVKFVDFCGRYRLPFAQFLCSPQCNVGTTNSGTESDGSEPDVTSQFEDQAVGLPVRDSELDQIQVRRVLIG
ncbi:hypothetical protein EG68_07943 [Paragonimus skrjabini miyazakii]|uniref:Leucine-rich repeat-containing protein 58 n=1 Tax=Paragonimus skrjabini miyazakii TaxID=59628 RepID=A0A8S9YNQ3_9TREM|nr:hypothetical protein EG68_07943 [Paragonimus skrjabini miyazakii]